MCVLEPNNEMYAKEPISQLQKQIISDPVGALMLHCPGVTPTMNSVLVPCSY